MRDIHYFYKSFESFLLFSSRFIVRINKIVQQTIQFIRSIKLGQLTKKLNKLLKMMSVLKFSFEEEKFNKISSLKINFSKQFGI